MKRTNTTIAHRSLGFTLVETLIYAAGVVILVGAIVTFLFYALNWYRSIVTPYRIARTGMALAERIENDLRASKSINDASSILNSDQGKISMKVLEDSTTEINRTYTLTNGRVTFEEDTDPLEYLSPEDITISSLRFSVISTNSSKAIRYSIDIGYINSGSTTTDTYSGVAILRNSYQ